LPGRPGPERITDAAQLLTGLVLIAGLAVAIWFISR